MKSYHQSILDHPELDYWELKLFERLVPLAKTLLDLGCGAGSFLKRASQRYQVMGIDANRKAVSICRRKGLKVRQADAQKTGLKGGMFDIVRAKELLEHLQKPQRLLAEVKRLLIPGGLLVLHVPTQYSLFYPVTNFWDDYTHIRPFSKKGLLRLLSEFGFEIRYLTGYTAGRNCFERLLGLFLGKILPFTWLVIAKK